jgi:hypothetical protein
MMAEARIKSIPFSGDTIPVPTTPIAQAQYNSKPWHEHDLDKI